MNNMSVIENARIYTCVFLTRPLAILHILITALSSFPSSFPPPSSPLLFPSLSSDLSSRCPPLYSRTATVTR